MAFALRAPVLAPPCSGCAGGGEVNGLSCRGCGGTGRAGARRARVPWRILGRRAALAMAGPAGMVVGWSRTLPGVGGAAALTFGTAVIAHSAWHWVPAYAVAALVGGTFGLLADRRIS